jgi:hypothetical protein
MFLLSQRGMRERALRSKRSQHCVCGSSKMSKELFCKECRERLRDDLASKLEKGVGTGLAYACAVEYLQTNQGD